MAQVTAGPATERNLARQHRFWNRRAVEWDLNALDNPGLQKVIDAVVSDAELTSTDAVVDLGCGSGQVTFAVADKAGSVLAVDISEEMIRLLLVHARERGAGNIEGRAEPIESLQLAPESVDVIVSNYVLHHLRDEDKARFVARAYAWLKPGGRLVIGDMMFGRGGESRDRSIIASKVLLMAKKGPAGWWRIAKNAARFLFRVQERPVSLAAWESMLTRAGFLEVTARAVVNEGAVVRGRKPV